MPEPRRIFRGLAAALLAACLAGPTVAQSTAGSGRLVEMDFRLAMAALVQRVGANGQLLLHRAQPREAPRILVVVGGTLDLSQQTATAPAVEDGLLAAAPDGTYTAHVPILVWEGAELRVPPGTTLALSRPDGAFIANLGRLTVEGARIAGIGGPADASPDFRPFVLTAGTGVATLRKAQFAGLGFGKLPAFSGVSIVNRGIYPSIGESAIEGSLFHDVGTVTLESTRNIEVIDNRFVAAGGTALRLVNTIGGAVRRNHVHAPQGHGIRVKGAQGPVALTGNHVEKAGITAIFVDNGSADVVLRGNSLQEAAGDGISLSRSACARLEDNLVSGAGGNGVKIRQSAAVALEGNEIIRSARAGVQVLDQPAGAETRLDENAFRGNAIGLNGVNAARLHLLGNDFADQLPRLVSGDLIYGAGPLLRDLENTAPLQLTTGRDTRKNADFPTCHFPEGA